MTNKVPPRAYVRKGPAVANKQADFVHLRRACAKVISVAEKNGGVAHFSVAYATPEQLGKALEWMTKEGKALLGTHDVSMYTDTNGSGKPRLWVQIILNHLSA